MQVNPFKYILKSSCWKYVKKGLIDYLSEAVTVFLVLYLPFRCLLTTIYDAVPITEIPISGPHTVSEIISGAVDPNQLVL